MENISKNKKVYYSYDVLDKYVVGIKLLGSEVKPLKKNKSSLNESFCYIKGGEVFIKGLHIPVDINTMYPHDPNRDKKLLIKKKEILKLKHLIEQDGLTLIPINIFNTKSNLIKLTIGVCKGKKLHDKRESIKTKDLERDLQRKFK